MESITIHIGSNTCSLVAAAGHVPQLAQNPNYSLYIEPPARYLKLLYDIRTPKEFTHKQYMVVCVYRSHVQWGSGVVLSHTAHTGNYCVLHVGCQKIMW